jgi:lipopolysaccharide export system permease protein
MKLLDRYIARQFLQNIAALFVVLFAIIIVIDFSLNFDEYAKLAAELPRADGSERGGLLQGLTAAYLALDLWWPRLFQLYNYMLGLVLVGAMGFTCAQMNRHREFVAILAGGISLHRIARPIVIVALALTVLQAANREFVIPQLAPLLTRDKWDAGSRSLGATRQPLCADAHGRLFYARSVDLDNDAIDGLWVWERDADGLMTRRITADRAEWDGVQWVLTNGQAESRAAGPDSTTARHVEPLRTLETDLNPTALRLRRFEGYSNNLSTRDLSLLIANYREQPNPSEQRIHRLERTRFARIAGLISSMLVLLLCIPFFLRRVPGNMLTQSVMAAPVTMVGFVGSTLGASAALPGLPPQLSVFVPVMVLLPLTIAALTSMRS